MSTRRPARSASDLVAELDAALRRARDPRRATKEKAYLKSPLEHYGASVPAVRKAVRDLLRAHPELDRRALLALVRRLWASPVHEVRLAAVVLLQRRVAMLEPRDLSLVEDMIRGTFTWAYVDGLAANVAGPIVARSAEAADRLDRWARDDTFWLRRAALLALLVPIRAGAGDWDRFTRLADGMLDHDEFFIRKAIGWVLREASKKRPERVRRYVGARLDRLSPLTFREAIKRLPAADRTRLREARAAAR